MVYLEKHMRKSMQAGFTLIELMVAMGISVILMAALAAIFATSVTPGSWWSSIWCTAGS